MLVLLLLGQSVLMLRLLQQVLGWQLRVQQA